MTYSQSARKAARRKLWPLAALAVVALIGTSCSDEPAETGTGSSTGTTTSDREQGLKFAQCIREHGVSDFPDPDASGDFNFGVSVSPAVWKQAVDACKELQPPGTLNSERTPEQQSASLEFARCIRENGVKDFPDPVNGEPLVDTTKIPSSNRPGGMTILNSAMEKCGDLVERAAGSQ